MGAEDVFVETSSGSAALSHRTYVDLQAVV